MMRKLIWCALALLLPAGVWAQDVGGPFIRYYPPLVIGGSLTNPSSAGDIVLGAGKSIYICNTADCSTNYERAELKWSGNVFYIGTTQGGTGGFRATYFDSAAATGYGWRFNGATKFALGQTEFYPLTSDSVTLGLSGNLFTTAYLARGIQGSKSKSLTDAGAAVSIERVAVPTNGYMGAATFFTANSTDGTNRLTTSGIVTWAAADTTGTVTCGTPVVTGLVTAYKRANTLICTFTAVTATTNCDLQVSCTDNLAGTQTMAIEHFPIMATPNTYTPQ